MFKEREITLREALGLIEIINSLISSGLEFDFQLNRRLNRQLLKLQKANKEAEEIRQSVLKEVLGESEFKKAVGKKLDEHLTDEQIKQFENQVNDELGSISSFPVLTLGLIDLFPQKMPSHIFNTAFKLDEFLVQINEIEVDESE